MRRMLLPILLLLTAALLQLLLPPWHAFGGVQLPLLTALVVHYALRREPRETGWIVAVALLLRDGLVPGSFGPGLLTFPVIGVVANHIRREVFADGFVTQLFFGGLAAAFVCFIAVLVYSVSGQRPFHFGSVMMRISGSTILGAVALPLVGWVIHHLEAALPQRRRYGWQ